MVNLDASYPIVSIEIEIENEIAGIQCCWENLCLCRKIWCYVYGMGIHHWRHSFDQINRNQEIAQGIPKFAFCLIQDHRMMPKCLQWVVTVNFDAGHISSIETEIADIQCCWEILNLCRSWCWGWDFFPCFLLRCEQRLGLGGDQLMQFWEERPQISPTAATLPSLVLQREQQRSGSRIRDSALRSRWRFRCNGCTDTKFAFCSTRTKHVRSYLWWFCNCCYKIDDTCKYASYFREKELLHRYRLGIILSCRCCAECNCCSETANQRDDHQG